MPLSPLQRLARLYQIESSYFDLQGIERWASPETLRYALTQFGLSSTDLDHPEDAEQTRALELAEKPIEPVVVRWADQPLKIELRWNGSLSTTEVQVEIRLENSDEVLQFSSRLNEAEMRPPVVMGGLNFHRACLSLPHDPPPGYHRLRLHLGKETHEALLLCAPGQAFQLPIQRAWGLFCPTYALHDKQSLGGGGLRELSRLVDLTNRKGGHIVGTLPLLSVFLGGPLHQPCPYVPVSKEFFNELFLSLNDVPEQSLLKQPLLTPSAEPLRAQSEVDYAEQFRLQWPILHGLAQAAFANQGPLRDELDNFLKAHPETLDYAQFRAAVDHFERPFGAWPAGPLGDFRLSTDVQNTFAYAQFRLRTELRTVAERSRKNQGGLYLDVPVGVHPDGYDAWRNPDAFLTGLSCGAPPDPLALEGQDWGFRPIHPLQHRASGYAYFIRTLQAQSEIASVLRIDHVMGLHRMYCVPFGAGAKEGFYVRYHPEELWAIVCIESHRNQTAIVGEDLGTVPPAVREAMDTHGIQRMYVAQFEMRADAQRALKPSPANAVCSLNTHDTATFAGFWHDRDIEDRVQLGHQNPGQAEQERNQRAQVKGAVYRYLVKEGLLKDGDDARAVVDALLQYLARTEAKLVLANLEDLWLEPTPQNVPGTLSERPNWKRKTQYDFDQIEADPKISRSLDLIRIARSGRIFGS